MADQKLSALTALTALTDDDIVYIVNDPGGTPASRKMTVANLRLELLKGSSSSFFYLGEPSTNGSWRIGLSGGNLSFEKRESGSWVQKGAVA